MPWPKAKPDLRLEMVARVLVYDGADHTKVHVVRQYLSMLQIMVLTLQLLLRLKILLLMSVASKMGAVASTRADCAAVFQLRQCLASRRHKCQRA